jgi:hypothetical protein
MDFIRALTFITEDERWKEKIAMGTVVALISGMLTVVLVGVLGIFIMMGYSLRLMQNVQRGDPHPLPEWDQWGEDLTRGFKLFIVTLVWSLPAVLVALPVVFGSILAGANSDVASVFGASIVMLGMCLSFLYGIFIYLVMPAFTVRFAEAEQISDGLRVSEVWEWTRMRLGDVIMFLVAFVIALLVIGTVGWIAGMVLCFVGLIVTLPLAVLLTWLYQYHLMGQLAYKARTGQPYPQRVLTPAPAPAAYDTHVGATASQPGPAAPAKKPAENDAANDLRNDEPSDTGDASGE